MISKKAAQVVTADLDRLAELMQTEFESLGLPEKVAMDFAYRCDLLSDAIEVTAADYDEANIGKEVSGPHQMDSDEPYMKGEFSQQVNRELREKTESNSLPSTEPRSPSPGKQADSFSEDTLKSILNKYSGFDLADDSDKEQLLAALLSTVADVEEQTVEADACSDAPAEEVPTEEAPAEVAPEAPAEEGKEASAEEAAFTHGYSLV